MLLFALLLSILISCQSADIIGTNSSNTRETLTIINEEDLANSSDVGELAVSHNKTLLLVLDDKLNLPKCAISINAVCSTETTSFLTDLQLVQKDYERYLETGHKQPRRDLRQFCCDYWIYKDCFDGQIGTVCRPDEVAKTNTVFGTTFHKIDRVCSDNHYGKESGNCSNDLLTPILVVFCSVTVLIAVAAAGYYCGHCGYSSWNRDLLVASD